MILMCRVLTRVSFSFSFISDYIVAISCAILVVLFSLQHHGTHRVGFIFAPIVTAWLLCISGIGVYNIIRWNPSVFHALSPVYMFRFLKSTGFEGWMSLGGVVLCITGITRVIPAHRSLFVESYHNHLFLTLIN